MSDTLILRSLTTTRIDVDSAGVLAVISGVGAEEFGCEMFSRISYGKSLIVRPDSRTVMRKGNSNER